MPAHLTAPACVSQELLDSYGQTCQEYVGQENSAGYVTAGIVSSCPAPAAGYGGAGGSGGHSGGGGSGGIAGGGGMGGNGVPLALGFTPSNVDLSKHQGKSLRNFVVSDHDSSHPEIHYLQGLVIDTDALSIRYDSWNEGKLVELAGSGTDFIFESAVQTQGGPEVALLIVNSLEVGSDNGIVTTGSRPLVVIAADRVQLSGRFSVKSGITPGPSGDVKTDGLDGLGPGGGKRGQNSMTSGGAGGGSYCSPGGSGGNANSTPTGGAAGSVHGNPTITPLRGGSSGARARLSSCVDAEGYGGGALQIVAGQSITIDGWISVPGGGGCDGYSWGASGAGSGGAILIEAPQVTLNGTLAANGGGGGGDIYAGKAGNETAAPASGGAGCKGAGAAGAQSAMNGADDADATCKTTGGGGGGGGWIRVNATGGAVKQGANAVLSPAPSTACATFGPLES